MRSLLAAVLLVFALAIPAAGASPQITVVTAAPTYGQEVLFTVEGLPSKYDCAGHARCARVLVECFQDGTLVYGQADDLNAARTGIGYYSLTGFILGGASSLWVNERPGTPASCMATLFRFDNSGPVQTYVPLASTVFEAAGS
jgi:hypothetical protein